MTDKDFTDKMTNLYQGTQNEMLLAIKLILIFHFKVEHKKKAVMKMRQSI